MQQLILSLDESTLMIKGALTRQFISQKLISEAEDLSTLDKMSVDLSDVSQVDTAGLAFLLLLIEKANKAQIVLTFKHLPNDLLKLAKLSAIDSFLSVA